MGISTPLEKACTRKRAYYSPEKAQDMRLLRQPKEEHQLHVYRCQVCRLWHLTKMDPHQ